MINVRLIFLFSLLTVCMRLEVVSDTPEECLAAKVNTQHANYRASLEIADVIKDLVHLEGVPDWHLDRVGGS